jgi:formylglycine-generating enzyme required for sulfatase activity
MKAKRNSGIGGIFAVVALFGAWTLMALTACGDSGGDPVSVPGVTLNKTSAGLIVGETETLTVTVANADDNAVTWSSNNTAVATVSDGTVTAVAVGNATITVTTQNGGHRAQCVVTVRLVGMVQIPAGTFTMGSPVGEPNRSSDEIQHSVTLTKGFYMGKYQVTQKQYQEVMGALPTSLSGSSYGVGENYPVYYVSWYDAIVFCNKLSMMEGLKPVYSISNSTDTSTWGPVPTSSNTTWNAVKMVSGANGYRLPTEAEWEYACRAGTTTAWYTADTVDGPPHLNTAAWYTNNAGFKTQQVGLKTANEWGLYDMHGNVWEWCWDWNGPPVSAAQTDPIGFSIGTFRVFRGGSWTGGAEHLRSAFGSEDLPSTRRNDVGFRLVRSLQ